ncbi:hypothetical protein MTQ01_20555 [Streptomyces sp. XM4193]|uniref:hypothetical protein n=1 Tax=Streptomyces sp. XM4193 TaxID=2929782 RepID=UPI001FF75837|nr:hypothetical protein [Streptomyces sp. XM4193]MCK1798373.1 hypothetical protein [Streptomyces sp. XM4193]
MSLTERYAYYLAVFQKVAQGQIRFALRAGDLGTLRSFELREDGRGVWAEVVIEVRGVVGRPYERSTRIIDATEHPPENPPDFAATLFAADVVQEDLDTPGLRQQWGES